MNEKLTLAIVYIVLGVLILFWPSLIKQYFSALNTSQVIAFICSNFSRPITILDFSLSLEASRPQNVWNAFHNPANVFYFIGKQKNFS